MRAVAAPLPGLGLRLCAGRGPWLSLFPGVTIQVVWSARAPGEGGISSVLWPGQRGRCPPVQSWDVRQWSRALQRHLGRSPGGLRSLGVFCECHSPPRSRLAMARGGGWAVMPACFSFTAQRLKPSLSHGRTRAELKFTVGRGRHVFCFAAGYEGLCFNGTATFLL